MQVRVMLVSVRSVICPVLVGRREESDAIQRALDGLAEGRGSTLVFAGEAGIGKSCLLRESAAQAARRGLPVLSGRAVERPSAVPYRPFTEALLSHLRQAGPPDLAELRPFRPMLGLLVPQWRPYGEDASEASLVLMAEAVLRLLRAVAGTAGCVLALEDLHWAGQETVGIVEYLSDNMSDERVFCVLSLRDDSASAARTSLHSLAARRAVVMLRLPRLPDQDVDKMAAACLATPAVSPAVSNLLRLKAEGLPFLVEELLATAVAPGDTESGDDDGWTLKSWAAPVVPVTFADSVRRRLGLAPQAREVLSAAALLGRSFDWRLLAGMTELADDDIAGRLGHAVDVQLLSVAATEHGPRFRFRHALTRDAILAELLPPDRAALAGRGLRAVEAAHPGLPGEWCELAAELAEQADQRHRAAELLAEAGRRSLSHGALATAEATLGRARTLAGEDRRLLVEIDECLCEVLALAGKTDRVVEVGTRLLSSLAADGGPAVRRARAHLRLARSAIVGNDPVIASGHLDKARGLCGGDEPATAETAVLDAQVALAQNCFDDAVTLARSALDRAGRAGRHDLACEALEVIGRRERQRDLAAAARAFAAALTRAEEQRLTLWRVRALHELGTIDLLNGGPIDRLARARQAALDAGALATAATVSLQMAAWFLNHFEPDQASRAARTCVSEARRLHLDIVQGFGLLFDAGALAMRGDRAGMEAAIEQALAIAGDVAEVRGAAALQQRAMLWLVRDDRARAMAELDAGMELLRGTPVTAPFRGLWALMRAIEDRDGEAAAAEVEASGLTVYWQIRGYVRHARAVTLGRQGHRRQAEESFAAADADLAPCDWYRHHARRLVAQAAIEDHWGDPRAWLTEALAFFDQTGHDHIASACRSLLRRAGAPVPRRRRPAPGLPPALAPTGITGRELEVLILLAEACTTRQIADRLYLSPKTVERHIANLAAKVGAEGRAQLIAFAASRLSSHD